MLDRYLDSAVMGKLKTVTIIHGKGTGALRAAVQQALKRRQVCKELPPGPLRRGRERRHRSGTEIKIAESFPTYCVKGQIGENPVDV